MDSVALSKKAEHDIQTIAQHIASDDIQSAERFLDDFMKLLQLVSSFSRIGVAYTIGGAQYSMFPISHRFREYMILYTITDAGTVLIVRVVHGKRDISALFR